MSLQSRQKFHRTSRSRKLSKDHSEDESLIKSSNKMIDRSLCQTPMKQSQLSIDDGYRFVINTKSLNQRPINIYHFITTLNSILKMKQLKSFYRIKISLLQKKHSTKALPYLMYLMSSISTNQQRLFFVKLKLNLTQSKVVSRQFNQLARLCRKKIAQYKVSAFIRLKQQSTHRRHVMSSNQKILTSVMKLDTHRQQQRQSQFEQFQSSICLNLKDKDYPLAKINIQNFIKRFSKDQKYAHKLTLYEGTLQMLAEMDKLSTVVKQSQSILYKISSFIDPTNMTLSQTNNKQIKKQLILMKNKFQNPRLKQRQNSNLKDNNNSQNTKKTELTYLQTIEKVTDIIQALFQQISIKSVQKVKVMQQYESKIESLMKQQSQINKRIQLYHDNEQLLTNITQKFSSTQTLSKQLGQINRRAGKRKTQFPFTFITELITLNNQHKKISIQFTSSLRALALLYGRKNLSQQTFNEQKVKIDQKYSSNDIYTNCDSQLNMLIKNIMQKARYLNEVQMKKLRNENLKLSRPSQSQRSKSTEFNPISRKSSLSKSEDNRLQDIENLRLKNVNLEKTLKECKQKIKQLEMLREAQELSVLQHDLVTQTLQGILQKVELGNNTWKKDIQVLKNGKNPSKYRIIFRITNQLIRSLEQHQTKSDHHQSPEKSAISRVHHTQRLSWDLQSHMHEIDATKQLSSLLLLQDNLSLDDRSDLVGMRQSNLLDFDNDNDKAKRLSFPITQQQRQHQHQHLRTLSLRQQSNIVSIQQMQELNSILVRILSQQYQLSLMKQQYLPNLLKNPYFANLVIMIESYLTLNQRFTEMMGQKQELENKLRESQLCALNERKLREWIGECLKEIEGNNGELHRIKYNERYWEEMMEEKGSGCIIVMEVVRLMRKYTACMSEYNLRQRESDNAFRQQHWRIQQLQQQLYYQQQLVQSLSSQLKQNQLKHKQQVSYYQRLSQHPSPMKGTTIQRTIKSSMSSKSIRSHNTSLSRSQIKLFPLSTSLQTNSNTKLQQLKCHYKQAISQMSKQQKKLLQQIERLNIQKNNLLQLMSIKDVTIMGINSTVSQLSEKLAKTERELSLQVENEMRIKEKYQEEFLQLKQDLQNVREEIVKQVELKDNQMIYYKHAHDELLGKYKYILQQQLLSPTCIQTETQTQYLQQKQIRNNNHEYQSQFQYNTLLITNPQLMNTTQQIKQVDQNTYLVTRHSISHPQSTDTYREISQLEQLRLQIKQLEQERNHVIQSEVLRALKTQQEEFNNFYRQNMIRMEQHFINQIIPQRVKQAQLQFTQNNQSTQQHYIQNQIITNTIPKRFTQQQYLQQKYQQWKSTRLPEIISLKQSQWRKQYQQKYLYQKITKHISENNKQWENQLNSKVKEINTNWQEIIREKVKQVESYWQTVALPTAINSQRDQWAAKQQQAIELRVSEVESNWRTQILPQLKLQWQQQHQHQLKQLAELNQQTLTKQLSKLEQNLNNIHQQQIRAKIFQVQQYWQHALQTQTLSFNKTLSKALQERTIEIETYWQNVMLPQIKIEWENSTIIATNSIDNNNDYKAKSQKLKLLQASLQAMKHQISLKQQLIADNKQLLQDNRQYIMKLQSTIQQQNTIKQQLTQKPSTVIKQSVSLSMKQAIYKLQADYMRQLGENKHFYEEKIAMLEHQKMLVILQVNQLQAQVGRLTVSNKTSNINTSLTSPKLINQPISTIQNSYQKQLLSLQSTIKNKQSQIIFIKRSLQSLTLQNQQMHQQLVLTNKKTTSLQTLLEETTNKGIKLEYEVKYLRQKEAQMGRKLETLSVEYTEFRLKAEQQKSMLQKKLKQLSSSANQQQSILQLKLSQLQSQLSFNQSTTKTIQYEVQRKKKQLQQTIQAYTTTQQKLTTQITIYKQTIKQNQQTISSYQQAIKLHESTIQDLRLQIRKSCDEINRLKNTISSLTNNLNSLKQQQQQNIVNNNNNNNNGSNKNNNSIINEHTINKHQQQQQSQIQSLIMEIERLRLDNYRLKEKLLQFQSLQHTQINHLKAHIQQLQQKLYTTNYYKKQGDVTEIQILKKINSEISQLVSSNKQLQLRVILLEKEKQLSTFGISIQRFFLAFQQQMDNLLNYLISNQIFHSDRTLSSYNKFQQKSREALTNGYVEDYFRQWQTFMRGLIEENLQQYQKKVQVQNSSNEANNEQKVDDIDDIIDKYDTVLNDVKFTLNEYIKSGDTELLSLMARSLGVDMESNDYNNQINNRKQQISNINREKTLSRQ